MLRIRTGFTPRLASAPTNAGAFSFSSFALSWFPPSAVCCVDLPGDQQENREAPGELDSGGGDAYDWELGGCRSHASVFPLGVESVTALPAPFFLAMPVCIGAWRAGFQKVQPECKVALFKGSFRVRSGGVFLKRVVG